MVMPRDISEGTGIPTGNYGTHFFCRGGTYFTIVSGILDDIASVLGDSSQWVIFTSTAFTPACFFFFWNPMETRIFSLE